MVCWDNGEVYFESIGGTGGEFYLQELVQNEFIMEVMVGNAEKYLVRLGIQTTKKFFSFGGLVGETYYIAPPLDGHFLGFYFRTDSLINKVGAYAYKVKPPYFKIFPN